MWIHLADHNKEIATITRSTFLSRNDSVPISRSLSEEVQGIEGTRQVLGTSKTSCSLNEEVRGVEGTRQVLGTLKTSKCRSTSEL